MQVKIVKGKLWKKQAADMEKERKLQPFNSSSGRKRMATTK